MRITSVELAVTDPRVTAAWYADVLGLPTPLEPSGSGRLASGPAVASVTIGSSTLRLTAARERPDGHHHLAFTVPGDSIGAARDWLTERVEVMTVDGGDIVAGPPDWDSDSLYFRGPDGSILELIARHRLPPAPRDPATRRPVPFGPRSLLSISEVGIPVADVPATVERLGRGLGLTPFHEPGAVFAAVGDDDGLLIVVQSGRTWFPTDHDLPDDGALGVQVSGALTATLDLGVGRSVSGHRCPTAR